MARNWCGVVVALALAGGIGLAARQASPASRTVYVTVTDDAGAFVTDLTPADLVVEEGGKRGDITTLAVPRTPMRIAVLVEARLARDTSLQTGLSAFLLRVSPVAMTAMFLVSNRNVMVVDYTSDLEAHASAINRFALNSPLGTNLGEGVYDAAKHLQRHETGRRVIVALSIERPEVSAQIPDRVLDEIRKSGAMFYAVTMRGGPESSSRDLDRILGDGTQQSGGRRVEVPTSAGFASVLPRIADELLHQYEVTYTRPEGLTRASRLRMSARREGITVRAPTSIPD